MRSRSRVHLIEHRGFRASRSGIPGQCSHALTPRLCRRRRLDESGTPGEITKTLAFETLARRSAQTAASRAATMRRLVDVLEVQHVEALAAAVAAEIQVVTTRRLADQRNLGEVRPRAAVRAAGDAQHQRLAARPVRRDMPILDQLARGAAGNARPRPWRARRSAARRRRARRVQRRRAHVPVESVVHDQRIDERARRRIDIRDGQVLVRREPEVAAMDASQSRAGRSGAGPVGVDECALPRCAASGASGRRTLRSSRSDRPWS